MKLPALKDSDHEDEPDYHHRKQHQNSSFSNLSVLSSRSFQGPLSVISGTALLGDIYVKLLKE